MPFLSMPGKYLQLPFIIRTTKYAWSNWLRFHTYLQISYVLAILIVFKVHGGTTYEDIKLKVTQAEEMARQNQGKNIDTVLFFDEANTTEALSMIKEVMVDRRINGRPIGQGLERLQFIAACNPYRRWLHFASTLRLL